MSAPSVEIRLSILPEGKGLPLPAYMSEHAAGCDIYAALQQAVTLEPGTRALIPAGFCVSIPEGYEAQIRPRSGLAIKHGITCLNSPGTIDADYRGPVCVVLANLGQVAFTVHRGDRIAQMIVARVERAQFTVADSLDVTVRADGGFGSTGRR